LNDVNNDLAAAIPKRFVIANHLDTVDIHIGDIRNGYIIIYGETNLSNDNEVVEPLTTFSPITLNKFKSIIAEAIKTQPTPQVRALIAEMVRAYSALPENTKKIVNERLSASLPIYIARNYDSWSVRDLRHDLRGDVMMIYFGGKYEDAVDLAYVPIDDLNRMYSTICSVASCNIT
jgi:ribosomal protein S13